MCTEIYSLIDKGGKKVPRGIPEGCSSCQSTIEEDCKVCGWKENKWKYIEIINLVDLYHMRKNGLDLMKLEKLTLLDFKKLSIINKYIEASGG